MGKLSEQVAQLTLGELPAGRCGRVKRCMGGRRLRARLADLGILPGTEVSMISNFRTGAALVEVRGSRYTLGRGILGKIEVEAA